MTVRTVLLPLVLAACIAARTTGCRSAAPPAADLSDPAIATFGAAPVPHPSAHLQPDFLKKVLGADAKNKIEFELLETMKTIVNSTKTQPDWVLCRGAG